MKKLLLLLLALLSLAILPQCAAEETTTPVTTAFRDPNATDTYGNLLYPPDPLPEERELIVCENGIYYMIFPKSEQKLKVSERDLSKLPDVTDEMIRKADARLKDNLPRDIEVAVSVGYNTSAHCFRVYYSYIMEIDPPRVKIVDGIEMTTGCGIDHEHCGDSVDIVE